MDNMAYLKDWTDFRDNRKNFYIDYRFTCNHCQDIKGSFIDILSHLYNSHKINFDIKIYAHDLKMERVLKIEYNKCLCNICYDKIYNDPEIDSALKVISIFVFSPKKKEQYGKKYDAIYFVDFGLYLNHLILEHSNSASSFDSGLFDYYRKERLSKEFHEFLKSNCKVVENNYSELE